MDLSSLYYKKYGSLVSEILLFVIELPAWVTSNISGSGYTYTIHDMN